VLVQPIEGDVFEAWSALWFRIQESGYEIAARNGPWKHYKEAEEVDWIGL